ncbi:hypothetical protein [Virgibacillus sp. Bac332]|uniref:hypothetical protein n=1 Tax=Virgibacillus sp. Bac332 TaxID=2419842 RepID=UPI0013CEFAA6|nr:hypothetical protein [Virgibacillus sp. Bac332]
MTEQEILDLIEKKITYYRKVYRLFDLKNEHSAGALEALMTLSVEIKEENEKEK